MGKIRPRGLGWRRGGRDTRPDRGHPHRPRDAADGGRCLHEAVAVARAAPRAVGGAINATTLAFIDALAPGATSSLQRDMAEGKPSELDSWNGAVVRLGHEAGVATPLHEWIYHSLLPLEWRARGQLAFPP